MLVNQGSPNYFFKSESLLPTSPFYLETATLHFVLEAVDSLILPVYKGSTFRGAFGTALRKISCQTGAEGCRTCHLRGSCDFFYIFVTPPPEGIAEKRYAEATPHPFLIEPPLEEKDFYEPGEQLGFSLVLIGRGIAYFERFVEAFMEMGKAGIGKKQKSKGRVRIREIRSSAGANFLNNGRSAPAFSTRRLPLLSDVGGEGSQLFPVGLSLFFVTPTRFCIDNQPVSERDFTFELMIRNLIRRISLLHDYHRIGGPSLPDLNEIILSAADIRIVHNDLEWYDWDRYSSRQDTRMTLGGFVGRIELSGISKEIITLLQAGEVVHVGKNTLFGMGKYLLTPGKTN
jgi:hypothetical protein